VDEACADEAGNAADTTGNASRAGHTGNEADTDETGHASRATTESWAAEHSARAVAESTAAETDAAFNATSAETCSAAQAYESTIESLNSAGAE
jgi:hypothetical protein